MEAWKEELYHHGILGQKWGKKNGPPYPLGSSDHSSSEKKAGWRKSLSDKKKVKAEKQEFDRRIRQRYRKVESRITSNYKANKRLSKQDKFELLYASKKARREYKKAEQTYKKKIKEINDRSPIRKSLKIGVSVAAGLMITYGAYKGYKQYSSYSESVTNKVLSAAQGFGVVDIPKGYVNGPLDWTLQKAKHIVSSIPSIPVRSLAKPTIKHVIPSVVVGAISISNKKTIEKLEKKMKKRSK